MIEKSAQFGKLLGEVVDLGLVAVAPQRVALQRSAAGRPADTQIDATRIQRVEHRERFPRP